MATGDKAAAKGLRVVPATKDLRLGYDDINKRGDELADEIDRIRVSLTDPAAGGVSIPDGTIWVQPLV